MFRFSPFVRFGVLLLVVFFARSAAAPDSPAADLKAKDVKKRLAAVAVLAAMGAADAEAALGQALADDDWEVVEHAVRALGEMGTAVSVKALTKAALEGRVIRVRRAASHALVRLHDEEVVKDLSRALRGDLGARAAETLAILAQAAGPESREPLSKAIVKALESKDPRVRAAAAPGLSALAADGRREPLRALLHDEDLRVQAAALAHCAQRPDADWVPLLMARLATAELLDVIERRVEAALEAQVRASGPGEAATRTAKALGAALRAAKDPAVAARCARLLGLLAEKVPEPPAPPAAAPAPAPAPAPVVPVPGSNPPGSAPPDAPPASPGETPAPPGSTPQDPPAAPPPEGPPVTPGANPLPPPALSTPPPPPATPFPPAPEPTSPAPPPAPPAPVPNPPPNPPPAAPPSALPAVAPGVALRELEAALVHTDEGVRAIAAQAAKRIGTPEALARLEQLLTTETRARPRIQALEALASSPASAEKDVLRLLGSALDEQDPQVRGEAAWLLGAIAPDGNSRDAAVPLLEKALEDAEWGVAVVAAVSLGKTRSAKALPVLLHLVGPKASKDWRLRGAAVHGLGTLRMKEAVPALIAALDDKDLCVSRTAYEHLVRLTTRPIRPEGSLWSAWWSKAEPTYVFLDWEKLSRAAGRGGHGVSWEDVYKDIASAKQDMIVLLGTVRGAEVVLQAAGVEHRVVRTLKAAALDVHPSAVVFSQGGSDWGERTVERLEWVVRTGALFVTARWQNEQLSPMGGGRVRPFVAHSSVDDTLFVERAPGDTPWTEGVFRPFTEPIYGINGLPLIEVLQPERVEVLLDSPDCATRWGAGNLACTFRFGHGVILEIANLFRLHDLQDVAGIRTGPDRIAYAMDHLGLEFEEVRRLSERKVWESQPDALKHVHDSSVFRLVTNFVRAKRRNNP